MADSAITFSSGEVSKYYATRLPHLKQRRATHWRGACPIHHGKNDNFAVEPGTGRWFCHSTCGRGGDILELEMTLTGADFKTAHAEVSRLVGRIEPEYRGNGTHTNGFSAGTTPPKPTKSISTAGAWREMARYPYVDRDGSLLYEVVRYLKPDGTKTFTQVRPSGVAATGTTDPERTVSTGGIVVGLNAGVYIRDPKRERATGIPTWKECKESGGEEGPEYHFQDCPRVPYRLPKLLKAETVYLPEGEKDVHTLEAWGLVASCNPGGSGSSAFYAGWAEYFRGKHIVVLPDNDLPGRKHAAATAAALLESAASVRIVELPDLPPKGDITDWRDAGGTGEQFCQIVTATDPLDAAALRELRAQWRLTDEDPHHQAHVEADVGETNSSNSSNSSQEWPAPLQQEAYYGVVGDLVREIEPHSEADPVAILIQLLVALGSIIGRLAHWLVEADRHFMNIFAVLVGGTANGRKGTSLGHVLSLLREIDPDWCSKSVTTGLSSGEGLIWAVRDEIHEHSPVREKGRVVEYQDIISDPGVSDKRLFVIEPEFASVLQRAGRESCTLSAVIRLSWDSGNLRVMTKKQSACATDAHISIIGHITRDELQRTLSTTEMANGFCNRFIWTCVRRSKYLPNGGALRAADLRPLINRLRTAVEFARGVGQMRRDEETQGIWEGVYHDLSDGPSGMLGSLTARAAPQVLRLSCLYALLDCSAVIRKEHMLAALEIWRYCEESTKYIFGDSLGDPVADEILRALRARPEGMNRTEISGLFGRNKSTAEIGRALAVLAEQGRVRMEKIPDSAGRLQVEVWRAIR